MDHRSWEPAPMCSGALRPKVPLQGAYPASRGFQRRVQSMPAHPFTSPTDAALLIPRAPPRSGALAIGLDPVRHPGAWMDDDNTSLIHDRALDEVSDVGTGSSTSSTSSLDGALPELQLYAGCSLWYAIGTLAGCPPPAREDERARCEGAPRDSGVAARTGEKGGGGSRTEID
ncbi:uncharacterized protein SCHCODRAFT_02697764 [Schizophyllum commune H4-8]|uniref:uncharacterized protein n=1 Tax=Schizophyllum commune (strain H4-8 / FGSC 9210) TaxID=578458 RepID=UPI00215E1CD4|nr:uncharacterized protein SCHCODRAFT_02697764 [Schizophyllum commune H4-8]KAI5896316.1 hypothetical protein SCHCODRAFT_02697764 [Schizophyllum commune H4-8]